MRLPAHATVLIIMARERPWGLHLVFVLFTIGCWRPTPAPATAGSTPRWRTPAGWQVSPSLTAIHGTSLDNLYATSSDTLVRSTDRGATWTPVYTLKYVSFDGVWATDRDVFVIANYLGDTHDTGRIIIVQPGGTPVGAELVDTSLDAIHGIGANVFVGGAAGTDATDRRGLLLRITNRTTSTRLELGTAPIVGIGGAGSTVYALAADGGLWTSIDAGDHYTRSQLPEHEYAHLDVSGTQLIATNAHGMGARSIDGGVSWHDVDVNGPVISIGDRAFAWYHDQAYRSDDRGATWKVRRSGQVATAIWGTPEGLITVEANGQVLVSKDGDAWQRQDRGIAGNLNAVWGSSDDDVYAVGTDGARGGVIVHVTSAGERFTITHAAPEPQTWEQVSWANGRSVEVRRASPILRSVWGAGPSLVLVAGDDGTILRSHDRGATWKPISSGTTEDLDAIGGCDARAIYAVGDFSVLVSRDGGLTWTSLALAESAGPLHAIACIDGAVYAAGHDDVVRLDSQVRRLTPAPNPRRAWPIALHRRASLSGHGRTLSWTNADGRLRRSHDGGASWHTVEQKNALSTVDAAGDPVVALVPEGVITLDAAGRARDLSPDSVSGARAMWRSPRNELWIVGHPRCAIQHRRLTTAP